MFLCVTFSYSQQAEAVIRIGAYQFRVSHGDHSTWNQLSTKYEKLFSGMLSETGMFELVPFKQIYELSDALCKSGRVPDVWKSVIEACRMENCRYIFTGRIKLEKDLSSAAIEFQLVDILTEETIPIKDSVSLQPLSDSTQQTNSAAKNKKSPRKQKQNKIDPKAAKEQLTTAAFHQTVEIILNDIAGQSPMVTGLKDGTVLLNRGRATGLKPGDIYRVYAETSGGEEDIFGTDYTEGVKTDIAFVQVKNVLGNSSTAEIFQNAGNADNIHAGDKIAAVPISEAQKVISSVNFPGKRPSGRNISENAPSSQQKTSSAAESLPPLAPGTIRIGIVKFDNKADNILDKEAGAITDLCTRFLSASDKIAVIEKDKLNEIAKEHRLNLSGMVDISTAAQVGKLASCQYILMGAITDMRESHSEADDYIDVNQYKGSARDVMLGVGLFKMLLGGGFTRVEQHEASVTIDARLVNVTTGKIEFTRSVTGKSRQTNIEREKSFKYTKTAGRGGLNSQAIDYASANLGLALKYELTKESPKVIAVNDNEITVNIGSSSGVHEGDILCLTSSVIAVKEVQPDSSIAEVVYAAHTPREGALIASRLFNEDDLPDLINVIQEANKSSAVPSRKTAKTAKAERKPVTFDKSKFEDSSANTKKVITSYGLNKTEEKSLLEAHSKASKMNGARKKYEAYMKLAQSTLFDYLASYNAAKYALELSMPKEAGEWCEKALLINPEYKPAKILMSKIKRSGK